MPKLSPTSRTSTRAASKIRAKVASYAVSTAIFSWPFRARMADAVSLSSAMFKSEVLVLRVHGIEAKDREVGEVERGDGLERACAGAG